MRGLRAGGGLLHVLMLAVLHVGGAERMGSTKDPLLGDRRVPRGHWLVYAALRAPPTHMFIRKPRVVWRGGLMSRSVQPSDSTERCHAAMQLCGLSPQAEVGWRLLVGSSVQQRTEAAGHRHADAQPARRCTHVALHGQPQRPQQRTGVLWRPPAHHRRWGHTASRSPIQGLWEIVLHQHECAPCPYSAHVSLEGPTLSFACAG